MAKSIEEIAAELPEWGLVERLPKELNGFVLCPGTGITGQILHIASYENKAMHCALDITYTTETFDYVPVKRVGMHVFRDVRFFARDREHFEAELLANLPTLLEDIDRDFQRQLDYEAQDLHFETWDFWRSLPKKIGDYELFITPESVLPYLNGSFIFLDYSDFEHGNQIYFMYNTFRNELFAEMKQEGMPITTNRFDVPTNIADDKKLEVLAALLEQHLEKTLGSL